jgi:hypothetical protein
MIPAFDVEEDGVVVGEGGDPLRPLLVALEGESLEVWEEGTNWWTHWFVFRL